MCASVPGCSRRNEGTALGDAATRRLRAFIDREMTARHIPGLTACLIHDDNWIWQKNFGYADMDAKTPMTVDHIQNVASISKTVAAVAALQQVEAGKLSLDADVNECLPFELRHPRYPDKSVTTRMLMHHTSGLRDGSVYARKYACGDPAGSLDDWVREYFSEDGEIYDANENFAPWAPGDEYEYTNTTYGLLGHLVELVSGQSFPAYCERHIFTPLGMNATAWMIDDSDVTQHVTPYSWVGAGKVRGSEWGGIPLGVIRPEGATLDKRLTDGYHQNCVYSHPNYPDGFLRMSLFDASVWARLGLSDGALNGVRILQAETVERMFRDETADENPESLQGLVWHGDRELNGVRLWGHDGSDPGVATSLIFAREAGLAAVVFANTDGMSPADLALEILREGLAFI